MQHPIVPKGSVIIGEGYWLGEYSCLLGANRKTKHCVIGANSVVTRDIPDYSVAVGVLVRVIKQFNFKTNEWKKNYINEALEYHRGGR